VSWGRRGVPGGDGGAREGIGEAGDGVAGTLVLLVGEGVAMGGPGLGPGGRGRRRLRRGDASRWMGWEKRREWTRKGRKGLSFDGRNGR